MNIPTNSTTNMKINLVALRMLVLLSLLPATILQAGVVKTWTGAAGNNVLQNTNNWSPLTTALPSSSANDTMQWDGSQAGNLVLTNIAGGTFDANPGFYINVTAGQVGSVRIVESNGFTGRIRLNGTNTMNVASGAGAFTFGDGGTVGLPIAPAGRGNGEVHNFTNNSANPITFNTDVYWVLGGGGAHTLLLAGTGDFDLGPTIQPNNAATLGLTVIGPGTVNYTGAPPSGIGITTPGTFGSVTVNGGTLRLGGASALGIGNTVVIAGGSLDSSVVDLVNAGNNVQSWNGNFGFIGTENLDLGFGPVTITAGATRIVTVNAKTLTVQGAIAGNNAILVKAGAGTLALNGFNTYNGGTTVSNGVLKIVQPLPSGTFNSERLTVHGGTLDLNGNSVTISSLNGTGGNVDTTLSAGAVTVTVGDLNGGGDFNGSIKNTAGTLALSKVGTGTLSLGVASTYSGGTTVSAGTLVVTNTSGSGTGSGAVTVSSGATFGGSGIVTGPVDWQAGSAASFVLGSPLTVSGSVTLNNNPLSVNVPGAEPLGAGTYTLMTYNNTGSSGAFQNTASFTGAGVSAGSSVTVTTGSGLVQLIVAAPPGLSAIWTNNGNGNWSVGANWSSNPQVPKNAGEIATLGQGTAFTTVTLDIPVTNGFVSFNNTNSFAIANAGNTLTFDNTNGGAALIVVRGTSNSIAAPLSLNDPLAISSFPGSAVAVSSTISGTSPSETMTISSGSGTLALLGNNTYGPTAGTVGTTISGSGTSTLVVSNNNALSTGDVDIQRSVGITTATALSVANNIAITTNTTTSINNTNNVTLSGTITGGGALAKNGAGTLTLSGANSYGGDTSINAGTVKLGNASGVAGGVGKGNVNMGTNTVLDLNGFSLAINGLNNAAPGGALVDSTSGGAVTLTVGQNDSFATFYGNIKNTSGSLALVKDGTGNQTLAGTNTYTGGTTINAGLLRVGNGNTNASAGLGTGAVVDNGTLEFNLVGTNVFTNAISGSGAVNLANAGLNLFLTGPNSFSGNVAVNQGQLWITNAAALGTGPKTVIVTGGGNSLLTRLHLAGNITVGPSITYQLTYLNGVLVNESGNNTLQGDIVMPFGGGNAYIVVSNGFLTLSGNVASDGVANGRVFQLGGPGNGLFSGVASDNAQTLGQLLKTDAGTWTVSGNSTTVGALNASAGKLVLTGQWGGGTANVNSGGTLNGTGGATNLVVNSGGKFVPGDYGSIGTFTVSNLMTWSGAMYVSLNKSLAQSNSMVVVANTAATNLVANTGSTLIVSNLGPALVGGDKFYLFNQPVTNGNLVAITPPTGVLLANNLAVDGSISAVPTTPTNITATVVGNQMTVSWPAEYVGWTLQSNAVSVVSSTNWFEVPPGTGSRNTNQAVLTIDPAKANVYFRLKY